MNITCKSTLMYWTNKLNRFSRQIIQLRTLLLALLAALPAYADSGTVSITVNGSSSSGPFSAEASFLAPVSGTATLNFSLGAAFPNTWAEVAVYSNQNFLVGSNLYNDVASAAEGSVSFQVNSGTTYYLDGEGTPFNADNDGTPGGSVSASVTYPVPVFAYVTNNGLITITGYYGSGGNITVPNYITGLPVVAIGAEAFASNANLTAVSISSGVTTIGAGAFEFCANLAQVTIPNSVNNVGQAAFYAAGLTNIEIPGSVGTVAASTFELCQNLSTATMDEGITNIGTLAFLFCEDLAAVAIPNSVVSIGQSSFGYCYDLVNVVVPTSVTDIGTTAFVGCTSLQDIAVSPNNLYYKDIGGVLFDINGDTLIQYPPGNSQATFRIPSSVTDIAEGAFYYCDNLEQIIVSTSVTNIGDDAFEGDLSLRSFYFEGNAPCVGVYTFLYDDATTLYYLQGTSGWGFYNDLGYALDSQPLTVIEMNASPVGGSPPLTVYFSSPTTDDAGNKIVGWNWDFGDGTGSSIQNPSHTYVNTGNFLVTLAETNDDGSPIAGAGATIPVYTNGATYSGLILNGGFETGDLTGWTVTASAAGEFVADPISNSPPYEAYSGDFFAPAEIAGPPGFGSLSQTMFTTPGQSYSLSFWLENLGGCGGEFIVSWNGETLTNTVDPADTNWANMQFTFSATSTVSILQFGFEIQSNFDVIGLDGIGVTPLPPSITRLEVSTTNLLFEVVNTRVGGTYELLTSTNLLLPVGEWEPVATNESIIEPNFTIAITNGPQRERGGQFYILREQ